MSFPRYEEYKDSGVEWLGKVPSSWQVRELKYACSNQPSNVDKKSVDGQQSVRLCNYTDVYYHDSISADMDLMAATATDDQIQRFTLKADDVIITKDSETADDIAVAAYVPHDLPGVICGYHLAMIRPHAGVSGAFIKRLFDSNYIRSKVATLANGLTRVGLSHAAISGLEIPLPPLPEQRAIATFLDRETSKIDSLVAEQRRLIELLKEKRQAVISHAVTKGLDPNVPMKDSGIQWLGQVPEHWEVVSVRRILARIEQGWSPQCDSRPAEANEWGILKTGCVNRGVFSQNENKALPSDLEPICEYEVKPSDVLMSRASGSPELVGATAYVHEVRPQLMLSDKTFRIHVTAKMNPKFFVAVFNSQPLRGQIEQSISGAEGLANNLPQSKLRCFSLALPPSKEQSDIVLQLTARLDEIDSLVDVAERAIVLLQERRTALISAAVTGKIDVRQFALQEST